MEPVRTIFDNDDTMLYKWAAYLNIPVRYVIVVDEHYQSLIDYAIRLADQPLSSIFRQVTSPEIYPSPNIRLETDIANLMADYYLEQGVDVGEVVDRVNNYYGELGLEVSVDSPEDLDNSIGTWRVNYERYLQLTLSHYQGLIGLEQQLAELTPLNASDPVITSITVAVTPRFRIMEGGQEVAGPIPEPAQGQDIWDLTILSPELPFIRFAGREDLAKVHLPSLPTDLNLVITPNIYGEGTITATVLLADKLTKVTASTYTTMVYRLGNRSLTIPIPNVSQPEAIERILSRIEDHTPLVLTDPKEVKVGGEFKLFNFTYNDALLLDTVLTNELVANYLFVDESVNTVAAKGKITLQYRPFERKARPSAVKATLSRGITTDTQEIQLLNDRSELVAYSVKAGTPYVVVTVTQADNRDSVVQFLEVFRRLLEDYTQGAQGIADEYQAYLGRPFEPVIPGLPVTPGVPQSATVDHLSFDLPRIAPHIFVKDYSKYCQSPFKPAIISPDYITEWSEQTFSRAGQEYHRQVLPYPRNNPEIYLVCPSDRAPFPGVKANARLMNKETYPYIPCCYEDDQTIKAGSDYNRFYLDNALKGRVRNRHHKIITNKVLEPGRLGSLSNSIITLLRQDPDVDNAVKDGVELSRYGVDIGPNSFLHSVALAVGDPDYREASDKEAYVRQLRQRMANFPPALVKQELYDNTDDQIEAKILAVDTFFDPSLFYRLVEETYQINIYVFYPPPNKETAPGGIELPRHRLFHARAPRQRKTVLILKHRGGGADALDQPQCELIVYGEKSQVTGTIFLPQMGSILHRAVTAMNEVLTWTPQHGLSMFPNLYSANNYETIFPNPVSQFVDSYGKLRGLTFPLNSKLVTVVFPPSQPVNLPVMEAPSRLPSRDIIEVYGQPAKEQGGVWYQLGDFDDGLFFYTEGGPDPLFSNTVVSQVSRIRLLKRLLRILLQYILWTFQLSGMTVEDYLGRWVRVLHTDQDNLQLYDTSRVERVLPKLTTTQQAIDYISRRVPGMIVDGKIGLPDQKTLQGVSYYLYQYLGNTRPDQRTPITTIEGLYDTVNHFRKQEGVAVFLKDSELKKWISSIQLERARVSNIRTELLADYAGSKQPYLYRTPENFIYLVQNTSSESRAIQIGVTWRDDLVNPGYDSPDYMGDKPPYVIYEISSASGLALVEDHSGGDEEVIQVLRYRDSYAALLPLLSETDSSENGTSSHDDEIL